MSTIGIAEVERIAKLAHIGLTPAQTQAMANELGRILGFVEQLQQVDIDGVEATDQVTGLEDVWREDEVRQGGPTRDELLANVPKQKDGYIVVKRVLNG